MCYAHDAVNVLVIHRHAAVPRAPHGPKHLGTRRSVLCHLHVHTRNHDLARDRVAQIDDVVNHGLLLLRKLLGIRHHITNLFLAHVLPVVGALYVQQRRKPVGTSRRKPHQRLCKLRKRQQRSGHALAHLFRVRHGNALGHQLAHHNGEVRQRQGNEHGRDAARRRHAQALQPCPHGIRQARGRKRGARKANERNGHLDGCQKVTGVLYNAGGRGGAFVALLGLVIKNDFFSGRQGHL